MVNYQILLHDYQSNRTLYEGLLQRLREAGVVSGLESGEVELVDLATLPVTPVGPGRMQLILIALAIGCCVAIVFALISEALDTSVHNVDELERYVGLPVLSVLPSFDSLAKRNARKALPGAGLEQTSFYEVVRSPQSPFSEGIRPAAVECVACQGLATDRNSCSSQARCLEKESRRSAGMKLACLRRTKEEFC